MPRLISRTPVAVIGSAEAKPNSDAYQCACNIGSALAWRGYAILCGGRQGVMAAAAEGCQNAGGICIGLLPNLADAPNDYCTVVIATDLGSARNPIAQNVSRNRVIVRAALCVFAIAGGPGTANELRFAWEGEKRAFGLAEAPQPEGYSEDKTWGDCSGRFTRHRSATEALTAFDSFVRAT